MYVPYYSPDLELIDALDILIASDLALDCCHDLNVRYHEAVRRETFRDDLAQWIERTQDIETLLQSLNATDGPTGRPN